MDGLGACYSTNKDRGDGYQLYEGLFLTCTTQLLRSTKVNNS